MTTRPKSSNPHRIRVAIRGSSGSGWTSSRPGSGFANQVRQPPSGEATTRKGGRPDDGLPNPQAFSLPLIQTYPARTAACRQCAELELVTCSRGCCNKLSLGHSFILNAIADGVCPLGKFTEEL